MDPLIFSLVIFSMSTSSLLFANAMNSANRNVIRYSQCEISILQTAPPAIIRKTNPMAIIKTSISDIDFSPNEYIKFMQKYISKMQKNEVLKIYAKLSDRPDNRANATNANCFEILPEAKGLSFFVGCSLSFSISLKSFII